MLKPENDFTTNEFYMRLWRLEGRHGHELDDDTRAVVRACKHAWSIGEPLNYADSQMIAALFRRYGL